jgi:hypothetical protein
MPDDPTDTGQLVERLRAGDRQALTDLFVGAGEYFGGTATLTNCTVSGNSGGGLTMQPAVFGRGTAYLDNTIVAAQTSGADIDNIAGAIPRRRGSARTSRSWAQAAAMR